MAWLYPSSPSGSLRRATKPTSLLLGTLALTLCGWIADSAADTTFEMSFRQLGLADGLSQNTVMDILQDSHGYLWLATENGLDRYNGYSMTSYRRGDGAAGTLVNDYIWDIVEDSGGNLWLATNGGGVAYYDRSTDRFTHFRHVPDNPASLPSDRIRALLLTDEGLWVATLDGGLALLDPRNGVVQRFDFQSDAELGQNSQAVYALMKDDLGRLWVGTDQGLAVRDPTTGVFRQLRHNPSDASSLSDDRVRALYQDKHGAIWVGTLGGGLNMVNPRSGQFTRYRFAEGSDSSLSNDHVRAILEDEVGRLWIGTADGLNVLLPETETFQRYYGGREKGDLTDGYIMSLFKDRGGVLWVGTRTGGVNAWNSGSWAFGHVRPDWIGSSSITSFTTDSRGYWVGTFGDGLHFVPEKRDSRESRAETEVSVDLSDQRVMSLLKDSRGDLWVGTMQGGVNWLRAGADDVVVLTHDPADSNSLGANGVMHIYEDSTRAIWFGTYGSGVTRFDPASERFTRLLSTDATAGNCGSQGRAFAEDPAGGIWIGTENGLCRYDQHSGAIQAVRHDPFNPYSLAENSVYSLYVDRRGRLWVGTGGGGLNEARGDLSDPDSLRFVHHTRNTGLASDTVYAILPGQNDQLWLSGNNGLTRFNPDSAVAMNYGVAHGLQGEEFHFGAAHRAFDGRLFFGGANGFNVFDPRRLAGEAPAPRVVLTGISLMNKPLDTEGPLSGLNELQLGYRDIALTLEYAALDFMAPQLNRYAYKLEGFDADWVQAGERRAATYTNLPGGDYVFRLRATGSSGNWTEEPLALNVHVAPPPWQTVWAYLVYASVFLGVLWWYARSQNRKLIEAARYSAELREKVRERTQELEHSNEELQRLTQAKGEFLARMSHEIRSPMNGVLGMADMLTRTRLDKTQTRYASTIVNSASSLLRIIDDILDFSKLDSGKLALDPIDADLEDMLDETLALFDLQVRQKGLQLVGRFPPGGLPRLKVDTLRLRQVVVNLLSNAIKFTERGSVTLTVEVTASRHDSLNVCISVTDTGIGIAKENQSHIFDSFNQEDSSTARRFGGTGLGLTISGDLVALMGGRLKLDSEPGKGSRFFFDLALEKAEHGVERESLPRFDATALVACLEPAQEKLIVEYLESWGMQTQCKSTGLSLMNALSPSTARPYNLLIVGAQLSDMSGADLMRRIRDQGLADASDILLIMGAEGHAHAAAPLPTGVHELREPVTRRELLQLVSSVLSDSPTESDSALAATEVAPQVQLSGHVLLVEDNTVNQEVVAAMLSTLGCTVDFAMDGRSGVDMAVANDYDVVLMDFRLPDINGVEATGRIRQSEPVGSRTPVIAFTANATEADRQRCRAGGMDDFLPKPCTVNVLAETLARWMEATHTAVTSEPAPAGTSGDQDDTGRFDASNLVQLRQLRRPDGSDLLSHAVDVFFRTSEESLQAIDSAAREKNAERLRGIAHRMKSGCDNLGAASLARVCRELEAAAERDDIQAAIALVPTLKTEHTLANDWLREQLRERA